MKKINHLPLILAALPALFIAVVVWRVGAAALYFMPHGECVFWGKGILSVYVVSNAVIAIAYFSIPVSLVVMLRKEKQYLFDVHIVAGFAVFILFCGLTHVLQIITVWEPIYWTATAMDTLTGIASIYVAAQLGAFIRRLRVLSAMQDELAKFKARAGM